MMTPMLASSFWLCNKYLLKSKDVLYQVSNDLDQVNSFSSSFPDEGQKARLSFNSSQNAA